MAYLVTARKWRPQTFDEVIGQAHISHTLANAITQGRIAHAYLFSGTRGVGKTSTARVLAKALNCEKGPTPTPCNQCSLCQEINAGSAVDVLEIDGASNRGIDEIRELRESVRYAPARGKYRIYIIDEVHMLTKEAFNALLKTLEEPPPHVVFIFATTEPQRIPITILSRCQRFAFHRISLRDIVSHLQRIAQAEGVTIDDEGLRLIAKSAEGSMRDAQSLFDQLITFGGKEIRAEDIASILGIVGQDRLHHCMEAVLMRKPGDIVRLVAEFFRYGYDAKELCGSLLEHMRNLLIVKTVDDPGSLLELPAAAITELQQQGARVSVEELHTLFGVLSGIEGALKESLYPGLLLEMTLLKMASLPSLIPMAKLLERLEELEKKLKKDRGENNHFSQPLSFSLAEPPQPVQSVQDIAPVVSPEYKGEPTAGREAPLWDRVVQEVRRRKIALGSILQEGRLIRVDNDTFELGFQSENSFFRESVLNLDNLKLLSEVVAEVLGERKKIKIRNSSVPDEKTAPHNGEARKQSSLSECAILQDALELFEGRIVETRLYQEPSDTAAGSDVEVGEVLEIEEKEQHEGIR
jgi:DNA polymerase-3 subunit gamma/tau